MPITITLRIGDTVIGEGRIERVETRTPAHPFASTVGQYSAQFSWRRPNGKCTKFKRYPVFHDRQKSPWELLEKCLADPPKGDVA